MKNLTSKRDRINQAIDRNNDKIKNGGCPKYHARNILSLNAILNELDKLEAEQAAPLSLSFKKEGHFLEEASARYSANVNNILTVRIFKCSYQKSWVFRFYDKSTDFDLDTLTCDTAASYWDFKTKKELIEVLKTQILNEDFLKDAKRHCEAMQRRFE